MQGNGLRLARKYLLGCLAGLLAAASGVYAQVPDDLRAQVERQAREIQELKEMLRNSGLQPVQAGPGGLDEKAVQKIVGDTLKQREDDKKKKEADDKKKIEDDGFRVGSDLKMSARWNPTQGILFGTPNNDFFIHVGGRFQNDWVWWNQDAALRAAPPVGIGDLQDGTFFRRVRIQMDGQFWEVFEFNLEYALEQTQQGISNLDEFWAGIKDVPWVGTARVGHQKIPQGFEGDSVSSSKAMTFLERSSMADAFYQNFGTGFWVGNHVMDDRATWSAMVYRQDNALHGNNGADFGDGQYAASARLTAIPYYENEGRCLLHLGVSAKWQKGEHLDNGVGGVGQPTAIRFRARPEMRDAVGDFGTNGLPGDAQRLVDTGNLLADSATILGAEMYYVNGPFSLQGEWAWAQANNVLVGADKHNRSFHGGYLQASYFLTGEHRIYDRRLGREGTAYMSGPNTPFWSVRGEDGTLSMGRGAWEVAARYSYLNLNDEEVIGGVMDGLEAGVNWYMTPNFKVQFMYLHNNRYDLKPGVESGNVDGFGTRVQIFF